MTDTPERSAATAAARRALALKQAAAAKGAAPARPLEGERAAAARSASKSKPWMKRR
jgi:hypothetical protein